MYVPDIFALDDPQRIAEVIARFNFALLVTALPGQASGQASGRAPTATHLPFLYDAERGPHGTLIAHMAKANPHWRDFAGLAEAGGEALVVFWGPHAYVSPSWYGPGDAVPTWNYIAVHAYGTPRPIVDAAEVRAMLERLVATHEAGAAAPWSMASNDETYTARMQRGIAAFEIPIARIEAKAKLSQNKTPEVRGRVVTALRAAGDAEAAVLADWMDLPVTKED